MSRKTDSEGSTEYAGRGDLARTMKLLWGVEPQGRRGPKRSLTVEAITEAAIAIAYDHGLESLSMRRLAERLDAGTMSLYRYVAGRPELLDLMFDRVSGEVASPAEIAGGWRARLEHVARENARLYLRHPWVVRVYPGRPPMGPGVLRKYDQELQSLEECGLSDVDMDMVLNLVLGYVRGIAMGWIEAASLVERTGLTDQEWWSAVAPTLERFFTPDDYPRATRIGEAATAHHGGTYDPELVFEFGLERLLDGIEAYIAGGR